MTDPSRHERRIIIIEDEPAHAEAIRRYLTKSEHNCNILIAGSLGEFSKIINGVSPDLVIADINLPDGSAFSLLQGDVEKQLWPVLIMTSYGDEEIAVKAIKLGALDYIVKSPEAFRNIEQVVRRNLREWKSIQQIRESERKFRILFETMDQGVIYLNSEGKITDANPAAEKITGISKNAMKEMAFFNQALWREETPSGATLPGEKHPAIKALEKGIAIKEKVMGFCPDDKSRIVWLLVSAIPQFRKEGEQPYQVFTTFTDITEMKSTEMELKKAKKKAEESDRLKSVFMANMSHEIRTPMNGILGFADLLKTPELSGESQKLYIEAITSSGKRMLDIINDLIDMSKIEAGQTELKKEKTNIPELLREMILFFSPEAEKKKINLKSEVRMTNDFEIETDRTKLAQIITNLLKNALKFTPRNGSIQLSSWIEGGDQLVFSVTDNGMGIRKELQGKIFERFRQGDKADEHEGVGLGLAISRAYVEMLGGEIGIESEPGLGSRFFFSLPFERAAYAETEGVADKEETQSASRLNVLVAEDDDLSYFLINETLKRNNISSIHASDGKEAVDIVRERKDIDLILMDIKLPIMNGLEATREIKKINPSVPVIAQSAYAGQDDIQRSIDAGCDDYISKPVDIRLLIDKINRFGQKRA